MTTSYDIIIIGTIKERHNYLGSKTFYLYETLKKYLPEKKIGIYDCLEEDNKRIDLIANNYIFTPWIETLDEGWCSCLISLDGKGKKILYTDNYYWYDEQRKRILQQGFNLENLFSIVCFSTRENSNWWSNKGYKYWGMCLDNSYFKNIEIENKQYKNIYVDTPWDFNISSEPYNGLRILNECLPIIKQKYPDVKIISQNCNCDWVDVNLQYPLDLDEMIKIYSTCDAYVVSHNETCGFAQFESKLCGTKVITNKMFSNHSSLLTDSDTYELWSFEEGNQSFIDSVEKCLKPYDKKAIKTKSLEVYSDQLFFNQIIKDLI